MKTIAEMRERLVAIAKRLGEIIEAMKAEDIKDEEFKSLETESETLEKEAEDLKKQITETEKKEQEKIEREERLRKLETELRQPVNDPVPAGRIQVLEPEDFKSLDEFMDVAFRKVLGRPVSDNRLARYYTDSMHNPEFRATQSMGEGTAGGYMIPTQWVPDLKALAIQEAIIRPRADVIPAGTPPDAEITLPVGDQSSGLNMGVDVVWVEEGGTKSGTDFALKEHSWIPHECAGYIVLTDKLLRNWPAAMSFAKKRFGFAIRMAEDTVFLNGDGVGKPKGILSQNCAITQARTTALLIAWADVRDMYWKCYKEGGSPVWITSPSCLPQIMGISDPNTSGTMIWQPSAREGEPNRLLGLPLIFNVRSPALGSKGDLMLVNLSYYVIKDGSGPYIAASEHVYFTSNKTVVKVFWNVDGDSWLQHKIPIEGDSSNYLSPFVILNE